MYWWTHLLPITRFFFPDPMISKYFKKDRYCSWKTNDFIKEILFLFCSHHQKYDKDDHKKIMIIFLTMQKANIISRFFFVSCFTWSNCILKIKTKIHDIISRPRFSGSEKQCKLLRCVRYFFLSSSFFTRQNDHRERYESECVDQVIQDAIFQVHKFHTFFLMVPIDNRISTSNFELRKRHLIFVEFEMWI